VCFVDDLLISPTGDIGYESVVAAINSVFAWFFSTGSDSTATAVSRIISKFFGFAGKDCWAYVVVAFEWFGVRDTGTMTALEFVCEPFFVEFSSLWACRWWGCCNRVTC
jgi:hypothetical protein